MKTVIITALLIASIGCSSGTLVTLGLRDLDTHYGKMCEKIGYRAMTDDWRECIMDHRRSRPGVTNADLQRQMNHNAMRQRQAEFMRRSEQQAQQTMQRGMCAVNGTC